MNVTACIAILVASFLAAQVALLHYWIGNGHRVHYASKWTLLYILVAAVLARHTQVGQLCCTALVNALALIVLGMMIYNCALPTLAMFSVDVRAGSWIIEARIGMGLYHEHEWGQIHEQLIAIPLARPLRQPHDNSDLPESVPPTMPEMHATAQHSFSSRPERDDPSQQPLVHTFDITATDPNTTAGRSRIRNRNRVAFL